MLGTPRRSSLALALLAATMLTPPGPARAAPGDALGPEFQVNSYTTDHQGEPAVAMDADGDFVVAWQSRYQDGSGYSIFAQRFDAAGVAQGPEFQVNTFTTGAQEDPAVAMGADGDFVVAWESSGQDGSSNDIFARRFDAAGAAQGPEVRVNTFTTGRQMDPTVAMDADGDFVVAWNSVGQDGSEDGVFTRRFDAAGAAQGPEVQVNTFTTGRQMDPAVAMDADGDFVVVWHSYGQDGSFAGVFARRFDAAGAAQGPEFLVNSFTANYQWKPAIAMDADGDFVVAWQSHDQDGDDGGVFAQRFNAGGVAQGLEFQVNTYMRDWQGDAAVAMDDDGDFVVTWASDYKDGSYEGIFAQRYNAAGEGQGSEFQVNSFTTGNQSYPSIAMDADSDFVVTWASDDQDGSNEGIFAQRFQGGAEPITGDFDGDGKADILWRNTSSGRALLWLMDGTTRLDMGSVGVVPMVWRIAGTGDFNGDGKADILWRNTSTGNTIVWQMDGFTKVAFASIGRPPPVWVIEKVCDTNGDGASDILWRNTSTGNTIVWQMSGFTRVSWAPTGPVQSVWEVR